MPLIHLSIATASRQPLGSLIPLPCQHPSLVHGKTRSGESPKVLSPFSFSARNWPPHHPLRLHPRISGGQPVCRAAASDPANSDCPCLACACVCAVLGNAILMRVWLVGNSDPPKRLSCTSGRRIAARDKGRSREGRRREKGVVCCLQRNRRRLCEENAEITFCATRAGKRHCL